MSAEGAAGGAEVRTGPCARAFLQWVPGQARDDGPLLPARGEKGAFDVGAHSAEGVGLVSTVGAVTPLCPAGHLPLKGGDQAVDGFLPIATGLRSVQPARQPFSPLEGEMSDRTEGGVARAFQDRLLRSRAGFRRGLPSVRETGRVFRASLLELKWREKRAPPAAVPSAGRSLGRSVP